MKRVLCLLLAITLLITCFAGCKKDSNDTTDAPSTPSANNTEVTFQKPENYLSVVLVTINPQFRLYLGADNVVLAVEPVNDDAKSINKKITFENKKASEVVDNLIAVANENGFIKNEAVIDIKVAEVADKTVAADKILNEVKTAAVEKLEDLKVQVEVTASVEIKDTSDDASSDEPASSSQPSSSSDEKPSCSHTKTKAVSVSTGKNIIDSSKLDVVNHNKVCADCGTIVGTQKHTVKGTKCTACGQANFATSNTNLRDAGISGGPSGHCGAEINSDGTPDFDYMMQEGYYAIGFETLDKYLNDEGDTWMFEIPEKVFYDALKTKFVINDALFTKLKAQAKYEFFWCNHSYSNGYFYIPYMAAGDVADYTHKVLGYKDNKKGSFTVYYDYQKGGQDVEEADRVHQYYYTVEYTYSGASNLTINKENDEGYEYYTINGWKPVVNSLRIKSIKKASSVSGITKIK